MQQVLFTIPLFKESFPPDGIPIYGFGAMLFLTFVAVVWWGGARAKKIGMEPTRFQDFAIILFISGIIGARILYMIQYANQFPDKSILGIAGAFFKIWEGGIVFYGSALGGVVGYGLFYWFVMRKLNVSGWKLADAVAPLLALGLAIGRIGCYLNGCCWGQVANEEVCTVPLGAAHFPLLPAHARSQLVSEQVLQTTTGFTLTPRMQNLQSVVAAVEPGSPAAKAGLKPGDQIVGVNGGPNAIVMDLSGPEEKVKAIVESLQGNPKVHIITTPSGRTRIAFDDPGDYFKNDEVRRGANFTVTDRLDDLARDWPRGRAIIELVVKRPQPDGKPATEVKLPAFAPETVGLYPTQLYETVSMMLLILFLLAYYPFRRHDGQLMVFVMIGYAVHRFINESLRIEPSYTGNLTLSQWGSVVVLVAAMGIELYLWRMMPSRWKWGDAPPAPPAPPAPTPQPAA